MVINPSVTNNLNAKLTADLAELLVKKSKHSTYQELHPWIRGILGSDCSPPGKYETIRWNYIATRTSFNGKSVADVGANTGYFSFGSLEQGAAKVRAFEGNRTHALFLKKTANLLGLKTRLEVVNRYFSFERHPGRTVDVVLCLNVLHHLGSDFGISGQSINIAKEEMRKSLISLSTYARYCWFQIGFNWKGDRYQPLFANGLKGEVIDFVHGSCIGAWDVEDIAVYNPLTQCYEPTRDDLLQRFDDIGEFLNRPLFYLKSS